MSSLVISVCFFSIPTAFDNSDKKLYSISFVTGRRINLPFHCYDQSHIVNALSLDNLHLSLRISSQNLLVVKPSVAWVIFLSSKISSMLLFFLVEVGDSFIIAADTSSDNSDALDCDDDNISVINLFELLDI